MEEEKQTLENEAVLGGPWFCPQLYKQRYSKVANLLEELKITTVRVHKDYVG